VKPVHRGREAFGGRLRSLREDARISGTELAARLGWQGSKISKIEHGRQTPSIDDVTAWAQAVGGPPDLLADLLADLRAVRLEYRTWSRLLRRGTAARQRAVAPLDAATSLVRAFEPAVIPGLLQTADYAQHVLSSVVALRGTPADVPDGVRARLDRQAGLYDSSKHFRFLMTEAALRYLVCPPTTLRGQLDRLLAVAGLETVELAVLGFGARLPYPAAHGFWLYDDKLVLVDTISAELVLRDRDDIELYERVFEMLWSVAATGDAAIAAVGSATRGLGAGSSPNPQ
jgi:transcriptional regulator with XRE-family HTH domain